MARRRRLAQLHDLSVAEWQTQTICSFLAGQAGLWMELKKGQKNPMLEAAMAISILKQEPTPEERELDEMRGEKVADRLEDDPRFKQNQRIEAHWEDGAWVEASNPVGSFEALMGGWGQSSHGRALDTRAAH